MKKYKHTKDKKLTERASFYVTMSVCMMAVGMAVWSAYSTVSNSLDAPAEEGYFSSLSSDQAAVAQDMTGVTEIPTEQSTQTAHTEIPTDQPTKPAEQPRGIALSETMPPKADSTEVQSALNPMQAVLKVDESLVYPVKSRKVIKEYSEDSVYNSTMKDRRPHTGCDFEASEGENVYAMSAGTVENIFTSELYGVIIEVNCGDYSVYYCGLSNEFAVDKGDEVKSGDTIGTVGKIPGESADGGHIHIEIRSGGRLIDPLSVIESDG